MNCFRKNDGYIKVGNQDDQGQVVQSQYEGGGLNVGPWNGKLRTMENGDISLPYSVAFVLKQMENFDSENCKIDVKMTILLRIKFNDASGNIFSSNDQMNQVMEHCQKEQKISINDEEMLILTDKVGHTSIFQGTCTQVRSSQAVRDGPYDMLQFTLRLCAQFETDFNLYANYPFDALTFEWNFKMSSFKFQKVEYRFDFYEQSDDSIVYKEEFDNCPELDIIYPAKLTEVKEEKKITGGREGDKCFYYPGFTLTINTIRDPFSKIIRVFLPAMVLGVFLHQTFAIEEFQDRISNLSVCLLAYIGIMQNMRSELPEISKLTWADVFLIGWALSSLLPILDRLVGMPSQTDVDHDDKFALKLQIRAYAKDLILLEWIVSFVWIVYMYCGVYRNLGQEAPKRQDISKNKRMKSDVNWKPLQKTNAPTYE